MTDLLTKVLDAHGGLDRYRSVSTITLNVAFGGPFWEFKGHADFVDTGEVEADLHSQKIRHRQLTTGRTIEFDRAQNLVAVTSADGDVIDQLKNPRATFEGYTTESKWSLAQIAYFQSYATWHYLPEPFVFGWEGAVTEEIDPWVENGESWRGLSVTFSKNVDTHNETQKYYFDDEGLLRRMDYQPVVNGFSPTAHYIRQHAKVDGIVVATKRHIHIRQEDGTPDLSWIPITLDLSDITIK
ncbi:hypothetical protein DMH04_10185 [Kibdelosporangium aridum]|uniref:Uncharacterized protein n=1 Tax=Kibdelosporangium aridum TaxID=2030 RepID=A0A428ZHF0_KIBAR|nr:hypothetical protein [Kibdelosporangium aridum]RSM87401.1 hypothetical protein DMH04_10185 [Kibdelosporangium aridum]